MLLLDSLEVLYTRTFVIKQNGWNKTYYEAIVPTMEFSNLVRLTFDKRPFMKLDGLLLLISLPSHYIPVHYTIRRFMNEQFIKLRLGQIL